MAVEYQKQYTSQASAIYDIAKSKSAFNQQTYDDLVKTGGDQALVYTTLLSSASKEDLEQKVDLGKLNLLNSNLQLSYLYNELQQDKSEQSTDAQGNTYNVYDAQKEYLDYEYNRALNLQIYNSLDWFSKSIYSVGGAVADAFTQVYSIIENIIDAGASVGGWIASLSGDTETADDIRKFIEQDITGKDALQKDVDEFINQYTIWDKNDITRGLREAGQSIARMAPMIIAGTLTGGASLGAQWAGKIIGTGMYYGAMAGQTTEETFRTQPEISWNNAMGYTLATTAIEAGTEFLSDKIFGSDVISRLAFGGTAARSALSELGMSLFTEGLEEATSEILDSLVYQQLVDKDAPLASFEDVLHAAVIGSLVGGLMTGGSIVTTSRTYVDTQTGKMYSVDDIDKMMETSNVKSYKDLKNIKRLGRVKSYNLKSILNAMPEIQPTEMQKLKAKYGTEFKDSVDIQTDIKNKYSKEYQRAVETDARAQEKAVSTAVKLSKFAEAIGIENFRNATKILENAREKALTLVDKFQNANNGRTEAEQQAKVNFEKENPGYTFSPVESMTAEEKYIDKVLYDNYKVHLYVGEIGSESGVDYNDLHSTPNAVYVKSGTINSESYQSVLDNVIKQQLVQQALDVDVLSNEDIKVLEAQLNGIESNELFADNKNLAFYKKMNTETLMQRLLFDDISINKVFFTSKNIFKKVYNHIKNAIKINRTKSKTDVNKIEFRVLNEIRNRYINNVAKSIGNAQDAAKAKVIMDLTPEEGVEKIDKVMIPNFINQHMLLLNTNISSLAYEKMQIEKFLLDHRVGLDKTTPLDYNTLLNPETYGGDENEFVRSVYDAYPGQSFQDALWNYISDNYHYAISPNNRTIYKEINMAEHSRQNFTFDVEDAMISKDSRKLRKYTKVNQILNNTILNYFNKSDLNRISIEYDDTIPGNGRTIVNPDGSIRVIINTSENYIYNVQDTIYHELSHALAELQGIPMGTSYNLVKLGLSRMSDSMVRGLANKMLDSDFLATATMDKIRNAVAYQIYQQSIGELYARGEIEKFSKGTDYFEIVGDRILGRGKYATVNGMFFMIPYSTTIKVSDKLNEYSTEFTRAVGIKKSNLESLNIDLVNDLRSEDMNESLLWEYVNNNSVGTPDMTNKVIGYLSDNPIVKTMKDIDLVKDKYLPALQTYYKLHPEATTVNIDDALKEVADRGNEKVTIDNKNVTVSNYLWNVTLKLSDMTTISGSKANQIILNKFTNYDKATVTQVLKDIRNNSITQEYDTATVGMEGNISRKAGEVSEGDITEDVQYREWLSEELGLGEGKRNLSQLKKSLNNSISSWLLSSGDTTGKTDLTRIVNASKEHNINRNDYFSVKDFINAIEKAMADTDNQFKVIDKIRNNMKVSKDGKSFLSEIFTESEIEEINNYLKENEYNTKSNLKAKLLRTVYDDVKAQATEEFDKITSYSEYEQLIEKYTKKAPEKSAEESILTTKDEESLEGKKEVSEPKIKEKPNYYDLMNKAQLAKKELKDDGGTYDLDQFAETGKLIKVDLTDGYQVSFFRKSDKFTPKELNNKVVTDSERTKSKPYVGTYGSEPEISFKIDNYKDAYDYMVEYNQDSMYVNGVGLLYNPEYKLDGTNDVRNFNSKEAEKNGPYKMAPTPSQMTEKNISKDYYDTLPTVPESDYDAWNEGRSPFNEFNKDFSDSLPYYDKKRADEKKSKNKGVNEGILAIDDKGYRLNPDSPYYEIRVSADQGLSTERKYTVASYLRFKAAKMSVLSQINGSVDIANMILDNVDDGTISGFEATAILDYLNEIKYTFFGNDALIERIDSMRQVRTTEAAQIVAATSQDYYRHSPVRDFMNDAFKNSNHNDVLNDSIIIEAVPEYADLAKSNEKLRKEIENLDEQIANEKDPYQKYKLQELRNDKQTLANLLVAKDKVGLLDYAVDQLDKAETNITENQEKKAKIFKNVVRQAVQKEDVKLARRSEGGILSPETLDKIRNIWSKMESFRYIAMLSSPTTAGRNAITNTAVSLNAIAEDWVASKFEKSNILKAQSQANYNGTFDDAFSTYVEETWLKQIQDDSKGSKYDKNEMDKLKREYAEERDPIKKNKLLSTIKSWEDKALSDAPWMVRRNLRNLKNMLAGAVPVLNQNTFYNLQAKYNINDNGPEVTKLQTKYSDLSLQEIKRQHTEEYQRAAINDTYEKMKSTNAELAERFKSALNGDKTESVKLAKELNDPTLDQIYKQAQYRANELLFKVDNAIYRALNNKFFKSHPATYAAIRMVVPFVRTTINTGMYFFNRSPLGLLRVVKNVLTTKNMYVSDMRTELTTYYKNEYVKQNKDSIADFKFEEEAFTKWLQDRNPDAYRAVVDGNNKLTMKIFKELENQGKVDVRNVGANDIFARARTIESISQFSVGMVWFSLGMILSALTGGIDIDDEDYLGPVIKIGDFKLKLSDLAPFSTLFTTGAAILNPKGTFSNNLDDVLSIVADQTFLNVVDSALQYSDNIWDFIENQSINNIQQYIPSILKNITKVIDNSKKDKSGSFFVKLLKTTESNLPGLSFLVANKINPYTGETERIYESGVIESIINQLSPIGYRYEVVSPLEREAAKLGAGTTGLSGRFTINNKDYNLSGKDKETLAKYRANYINSEYNKMVSGKVKVTVEDAKGKRITTNYNSLSQEDKTKVLKNLYSKGTEMSKIKYWTSQGNTYIATDINTYNEYRKLFGSNVQYRRTWSKSKFIEK